jgi:hypothetical protein
LSDISRNRYFGVGGEEEEKAEGKSGRCIYRYIGQGPWTCDMEDDVDEPGALEWVRSSKVVSDITSIVKITETLTTLMPPHIANSITAGRGVE